MNLSELQSLLSKAQSIVGDAPVIFKAIENAAETEFKAIELSLSGADAGGQTVTVTHAPAEAQPAEQPAEQPAAPEAQNADVQAMGQP